MIAPPRLNLALSLTHRASRNPDTSPELPLGPDRPLNTAQPLPSSKFPDRTRIPSPFQILSSGPDQPIPIQRPLLLFLPLPLLQLPRDPRGAIEAPAGHLAVELDVGEQGLEPAVI